MGTQARQLAVGMGGDTAEPALGGGGYIEILGNLERADHKPIIRRGGWGRLKVSELNRSIKFQI